MTLDADHLAEPGQRMGAVILDGLVVVVPFIVLGAVLFWNQETPLWFRVLPVAAFGAYEIVGTALWGQTVGKRLVNIRVRALDRAGPPGWLRAGKRWAIFMIAGSVPILGGWLIILIGLPLLWTKNRQGVHDLFAGTVVVRNEALRTPVASGGESETGA